MSNPSLAGWPFDTSPSTPKGRLKSLFSSSDRSCLGAQSGHEDPGVDRDLHAATKENLRGISATGASSGGVALYHAVGLTPAAATLEQATGGETVEEGSSRLLTWLRHVAR